MGFFKDLFKRKKNGTRIGNLLRAIAYNNTGGLLGENMGQSYVKLALNPDKDDNSINPTL
jgi:hypothetical protein